MTDRRPDFGELGRRLARASRTAATGPTAHAGKERAPQDGRPAPLSYVQEGIWLFEQIHPGTPVNNLAYCARVEGALDAAALCDAVERIAQRHDLLRTTFTARGQQVDPRLRVRPEVLDAEGESEEKVLERAAAFARTPFDLRTGPLLRVALHRMAADRWLLTVVAHHVIADGWSLGVFLEELAAAYGGAELPPVQQYAELAARQRERPVPQSAVDYWREKLADRDAVSLPADEPRRSERSFTSDTVPVRVAPELAERIRESAVRWDTTPFVVLLAALKVLLARSCGHQDITVGSPVAGLDRAHAPRVLGPLINMTLLRTDLGGAPAFREVVERVRRTTLDAMAHDGLPFERLQEAARQDFDVLCVLQDQPAGLRLGQLTAQPLLLAPAAIRHELELYLWSQAGPDGPEFTGFLGYDADIFERRSAVRLAERYTSLLKAVLAHPDRPLSELPLLSRADEDFLVRWSHGSDLPECEALVHERFEAQAERTPDATAVRAADGTLGYAELDARANQIAHHLRTLGVGPETLVGVCLERTLDLPVTLLGIWKAGGAYVPIDPAYPAERIDYLLADARAATVITAPGTPIDDAAHTHGWHTTHTEDARHQPMHRPPDSGAAPVNLAYAIYTSGSTGNPKGVLIEHSQTACMLTWAAHAYTTAELANVLASTSICFDLSVYELFAPLTTGGSVTLARYNALDILSPGGASDGGADITLVNTVPSIAQELLHQDALPATTTTVNLAGEPLPPPLVDALYAAPHVTAVHNLYGPSEDTTYSTHARTHPHQHITPIGHPLPHTTALILDEHLNPVPPGAIGELYLSGHGTTRGYHHLPAQTAERYLPHPDGDGTRVYRTGDLARHHPDGHLEYHGRADDQIKLHGQRIEPAEIEAALLTHPDIDQAAVATHDHQLVAYLAAPALTPRDNTSVQQHMRRTLPQHLTPTMYVHLDELPITPNHKIDRKRLPHPKPADDSTPHEPPRTPTEQLLVVVWQEVLGVPQLSIHDNFFSLGGHSLLAMRVGGRLNAATGRSVPLHLLFRHPTVAELAAAIDGHAAEEGEDAVLGVGREWSEEGLAVFPASHGQERMWFLSELDAQAHRAYHMTGGVHIVGPLDIDALENALNTVVQRHETLRTTFRQDNDGIWQVIHYHTPHTPLTRTETHPDTDPDILLDDQPLFDLHHGPLFHATLTRHTPEKHSLILSMHHAISDGWSLDILLHELTTLYENPDTSLPELTTQYADYTIWQNRHDHTHELTYWREQLAHITPLQLTTDYPRPPRQTFNGAAHPIHIDSTLTHKLETLAHHHNTTLFTLLLAAWQKLLAHTTGQPDITTGTPINGRTHTDLENLIGFFVNTLPIRTQQAQDHTLKELIQHTQQTLNNAYLYQNIPFEKLVHKLHPQRDLSRSPLFQNLFTLNNQPLHTHLPETHTTPLAPSHHTTQFEITLHLTHHQNHLQGHLTYNTDLYQPHATQQLTHRYIQLLTALTETSPHTPLAHIHPLNDTHTKPLTTNPQKPTHTTPQPTPYQPPNTEAERLLTDLWEQALGVERVGVHDNFFELGGHSLLAARIANKLHNVLGQRIELQLFFEFPTVAEMAAHLPERSDKAENAVLGVGREWSEEGLAVFPASHGQERMWFLSELDAQAHRAYHMTGGVHIVGPLDIDALENALNTVVQRHETLRTTFRQDNDGIWQVIHYHTPHTPLTRTETHPDTDPDILLDDQPLFDLHHGPLFHATLTRHTPEKHSLILSMHHAISDGWSLDILLHELTTLYENPDTSLPELTTQYADYTIWQNRHDHTHELTYWREQLAHITPLQLTTDYPRPPRQTFNGAAHPIHIDSTLTHKLETLAHHHNTTLFTLLLAAWQKLLAHTTGQPDITTGTPINGRTHTDLENLIGFFVNTLPIRTQQAQDHTLKELIQHTQQTLNNAYLYQNIPFEKLVHKLHPQRDLSRSPLFQNLFTLNNQPLHTHLPETHTTPLAPSHHTTQFEITLHLTHHQNHLQGHLTYNTDLYQPHATQQLTHRYIQLLTALTETSPHTPLAHIHPLNDTHTKPLTTNPQKPTHTTPQPTPYQPPNTEAERLLTDLWEQALGVERVGVHDNFFELGGHSLLAARIANKLHNVLGQRIELQLFFEFPTVAELAPAIDAHTAQHEAAPQQPIRRLKRTLTTEPQQPGPDEHRRS
ncbi:amino acid adenylation domain-containing protein [Actinopolyspora saharensis]|uniref:amino acid adenylation domain-containing protein n=1 Tax=Actinopolyspora saharensis TaxID=995062 RepID=UPI003F66966D